MVSFFTSIDSWFDMSLILLNSKIDILLESNPYSSCYRSLKLRKFFIFIRNNFMNCPSITKSLKGSILSGFPQSSADTQNPKFSAEDPTLKCFWLQYLFQFSAPFYFCFICSFVIISFLALQAHEADDDSMTSYLEDSKREMDKLRDEINQIKKMINSKTKETNKLRTQLEKISKERDQAQATIGKNLLKLQCSKSSV